MNGTSLRGLVESLGAEGFYHKVCQLLNEKQVTVDDFSYYELAEACGVLPSLRSVGRRLGGDGASGGSTGGTSGALLREAGPGVSTSLFQVVTGELIGRKVIEGYEDASGFIGDKLVTVIPSRYRQTKLAGFRALAGPSEVHEGHPYEESTFGEKSVTTSESKQGRILSINEELIAFDQTGEINRRAMQMGFYLRQERERAIVRGVSDADAGAGKPVYRPGGVGTGLYATNGSHRNWVGAGNTTSSGFATAVPLEDWTDIETVLHYRATQVVDDRVDGSGRPIVMPVKHLLVPEALRGRATSIVRSTEIRVSNDDGETKFANPVQGLVEVLSSPFLDEQGGEAAFDWYLGDFRKQFVWTEIWPVQTFLQRAESEAAFERDVVLRVKVRYFGGISAVDTVGVTKVDGRA
jgi:hypothetical protein